jgi:integrase
VGKLFARLGADENYRWIAVEIDRHGKPARKSVENATSYFLRYTENGKRKIEPAGKELDLAVIKLRNRELIEGGAPELAREFLRDAQNVPRVRIADAAQTYCRNLDTLGKSKATIRGYTSAVGRFAEQCPKLFMDEITRQDILDHLAHLKLTIKKRSIGDQNVTLEKHLRYLSAWLTTYGMELTKLSARPNDPGLLFRSDWPRTTKKIVDVYSPEIIRKLLDAASEREKLVVEFFLYSGCRDEEAAYAEWSDIDTRKNTFKIQGKPHYGWAVKDHEERIVPLRAGFVKRLLTWRARNPGATLLFPNGANRPDMHLIRLLQSAARKAKITERVTLHRFRRTLATEVARREGIATAQKLLGHSDLETTAAYLSARNLSLTESRDTMERIYSNLAGD